jgi:hypothetical protein
LCFSTDTVTWRGSRTWNSSPSRPIGAELQLLQRLGHIDGGHPYLSALAVHGDRDLAAVPDRDVRAVTDLAGRSGTDDVVRSDTDVVRVEHAVHRRREAMHEACFTVHGQHHGLVQIDEGRGAADQPDHDHDLKR